MLGFTSTAQLLVIAGVLPAVRASRVPPLAALREVAAEPAVPSRQRIGIGAALLLGGAAR